MAEKTLVSSRNAVDAQVGAENLGDPDGAVGLLKILDHRNPSTAHSEAGAVQRMHQVALVAASWFEADSGAACLKGLAIGTRRDFAKFVARRKPNLDVVGFCGGEAHVPGAQYHGAMLQTQLVQNGLAMFGQGFVLFVTFFRVRELEELDFLELMLAEDAAGIFSGGSGFRAEAGCPGGDVNWQLFLGNGFVAIKVVEFDL